MPANDDLLRALWLCVERAGAVERELRVASEELAAWRQIAEAAVRALDAEIRGRKDDEARTIA